MRWLSAVEQLRSRHQAGVLVTLVEVRGHAPRDAGAKMVVSAEATWDTIGGGNLEAEAIDRARLLLSESSAIPKVFTSELTDRATPGRGVQCCGGVVTVLLEPLPKVPVIAIFGVGHVGLELARILARQDLDLHLIDSRPEQLTADRLAPLADADARVHLHRVPVLPELVLGELPRGAHVLVMTHDHAEDLAIIDAALRTDALASIGLIGSSAKWARFRKSLHANGLTDDDLARVTTPIGTPVAGDKSPATIALSIASALLLDVAAERVTR